MQIVSLIVDNIKVKVSNSNIIISEKVLNDLNFCFLKINYSDGFVLKNIFKDDYLSVHNSGLLFSYTLPHLVFKQNKIFLKDIEQCFVKRNDIYFVDSLCRDCCNFSIVNLTKEDIPLSLAIKQDFCNLNLLKELLNSNINNVYNNQETLLSNVVKISNNRTNVEQIFYFLLDNGCIPDNNFYRICFLRQYEIKNGFHYDTIIDEEFILKIMLRFPETLNEYVFLIYLKYCENEDIFNLFLDKDLNYDYISRDGETFLQVSFLNYENKIDFLLTKSYKNINTYNIHGYNAILECLHNKSSMENLEKILQMGADPNSICCRFYTYHTLDYNSDYHEILIKYGAQEKLSLKYYKDLNKIFNYEDIKIYKERFKEYLKNCQNKKESIKLFNSKINKCIFINIFEKKYYSTSLIIPEIINLICDYLF